MFEYLDEDRFYDFKAKTLSKEGKKQFREDYFGYMYLDDDFYNAIDWAKGECIEDVKGDRERPDLFVMYESGPKVFDRFDFGPSGTPAYGEAPLLRRDFAARHPELYHVEYIVNLNRVSETQLSALFRAPLDKPKNSLCGNIWRV